MEAEIAKLETLGKSKKLMPAEQVLMSACHDIDKFLTSGLDGEITERIFRALLSLLGANQGEYSLQCALYIAAKIVKLFALSTNLKFWDVINAAIAQNSPTAIIAAGYVCRHVGGHSKSQIPRFVEHILKQENPSLMFACLHAMRSAFKVAGSHLQQYMVPCIEFTKGVIQGSRNQGVIWTGLKLIRTLLKLGISTHLAIECAHLAMKNKDQPFILSEVACVVATAAYEPYAKLDLENILHSGEWSLGTIRNQKKVLNLGPAFEVMTQFKAIFAAVWTNFLNLMGPELIAMNHKELFNYVRTMSPECVRFLIPMLPADLRFGYFREVAAEQMSAEQLKTLKILSPDDGCIEETAGVALVLAMSEESRTRRIAVSYFTSLAETHTSVVLPYFRNCLIYLVDPPESGNQWTHIRGNAAVLCAILESLPDVTIATVPNEEMIRQFVESSLAHPNAASPKFISAFRILSLLPESFSNTETVKKAVDYAIEQLVREEPKDDTKNMKHKLMKSVCALRARYPDANQNSRLIAAIGKQRTEIPFAVVNDLCHIIPSTTKSDPMAFPTTKLILQFAIKAKPSQKLVKQYLKRPLPTATDLLSLKKPISQKQMKIDNFLKRFIVSFPKLLGSCTKDDKDKLISILLSNITVTSMLILIEVSELPGILPKTFCKSLLGQLASETSLIQVKCECLARHAKQHPILPELLNYVQGHQDVSSCFLLSAIFSHVTTPSHYLSQAIIFLNSMMKHVKYSAIAVHALTSMLITHQMQLTSIGVASNQFMELLVVLHSPGSMLPVTLHLLGECFRYLIESFPSELDSKFSLVVDLILRTFEFVPISYAKEVYFESARAVYMFAHQMSHLAPIEYPKSPAAPSSLQLRACAAFSDFLKFEHIPFNEKEVMRKLLTLLQRTSDERAAHFIVSIASMMTSENVSFWISTIKRILISDSLLEGAYFTIEPTPEVKVMCLEIATILVPTIAAAPVLHTEHLDDLISSVCRAAETDRLKLQEAAFNPLQKVIELFKDRVTDEGQRLLDLYDSQFSTAVKVGFKVNLAVSGSFLSTYLTFNTDNMASDPENCSAILVVYLSGLRECPQRTAAYFSLATHLCTVARKYPPLCDLIQPFLNTLAPIFSDLVLQEMQLFNSSSDWREMARFRTLASSFYRELLSAFVWLQKLFERIIDINVLVSLFVIELRAKREPWIMTAAFEALPVAIGCFGKDIQPELLELSVRVANEYVTQEPRMQASPVWFDLLNCIAVLLDTDNEQDGLRELLASMVLSSPCYMPKIIGLLLHGDQRKCLKKYSLLVFVRILQNWSEKSAGALISILFEYDPDIIGLAIQLTLEQKSLPLEFQIESIANGLCLVKDNIPLDAISRFVIGAFKRGAMHMVGRVVVDREDIGVALLADGAAKAAFLLSLVEKGNARAYLRFIQLCLSVLKKYPMGRAFSECALRLAVEAIAKYGGEVRAHGKYIVSHSVCIAKEAVEVIGPERSAAIFDALNEDERRHAVAYISSQIRAVEQRKKTENLVPLSKNIREQAHDEWQTLTVGDISSDDA